MNLSTKHSKNTLINPKFQKDFIIANDQGVHARPATSLVRTANLFKSIITVTTEDKTIDLKSIMGILSLGLSRGTLITVKAEGEDAKEAIDAITQRINEFNLQ